MAWIVGDSFDYYSSTGDTARSVWDSSNTAGAAMQLSAPRFTPGQSLGFGNNATFLTKNFGSNESTVWVNFAYYRPGALTVNSPEVWHSFFDGGTAQCTLAFFGNGNIVLLRGGSGGTVIATYTAGFNQDVWTHFQCQIVFNGTTGSLTIRKNGSPTNNFSATGLNTISTANAYANSYANGFGSSGSVTWPQVDDLFLFSSSGAAPNTWVGDVRAICLMPVADTAQKNFAPQPTNTLTFGPGSIFASPTTLNANTMYVTGIVAPNRGGPVTKLTATSSGAATGHVQMAVYANDGPAGQPGTLLGTSAVVTNPPASGTVDFTFATPVNLSPARKYYFAFLLDVNWAVQVASGITGSAYLVARTYGSGFPNPANAGGALGVNPGNSPYAVATVVGNCTCVSELLANGDTDYVTSTNPTDEDLYLVDSLPVTPAAIIGVVSKVYVKKSDAGARTGQLRVKSGATEVAGVDTAVSTTYTYLARVDTTDPNTGAAWTQAGVNALTVGQRVTS
jgi:hypothetical protein